MKILQMAAVACSLCVLTGCGSFLGRMTQKQKPYPGLRFVTKELPSQKEPAMAQVLWLDVPLSLAVDTVLLPVDALNATAQPEAQRSSPPSNGPKGQPSP